MTYKNYHRHYHDNRQYGRGALAILGAAVLGAGIFYLGTISGCKRSERPTYDIHDNLAPVTIINSDVDVRTNIIGNRIQAGKGTYKLKPEELKTISDGKGKEKGKDQSKDEKKSGKQTLEDLTKEKHNKGTSEGTSKSYEPVAEFTGCRNQGYDFQADDCPESFRLPYDSRGRLLASTVRSIEFRNNGYYYGSYRLSSMPSNMQRQLDNIFNRGRVASTRGRWFRGYNNGTHF